MHLRIRPRNSAHLLHSSLRGLASAAVLTAAAALLPSPCHAAFHFWSVKELFTNLDGSEEYIEMTTTMSGQTLLGGQKIEVTTSTGTVLATYTIPAVTLPSTTNGHDFLIATSTVTAANGVTPDVATLPAGFLLTPGAAEVELVNSTQLLVPFMTLPTDGIHAENISGEQTVVNSAQNFAGNVAQVVPEPANWGLIGVGGLGCCLLLRRVGARPAVKARQ